MRVVDPCRLLVELHEERRVTLVKTARHAVGHVTDLAVDAGVLHHKVVGVAESQERPETQRRRRVGLEQGVAYQDAVLV